MLRRALRRLVMIDPGQTLDPDTMGVRTVGPNDSSDLCYSLLRRGHYVEIDTTLSKADAVFMSIVQYNRREFPPVDVASLIEQQAQAELVFNRLVIPRQFWLLSDFADPELNKTFWKHLQYFSVTHWSTKINREFREFCEKSFPLTLHSHLPFSEYLRLVSSFAAHRNGVNYKELIGSSVRLRPLFGVPCPRAVHLQHVKLFLNWFKIMAIPLMLQRCLVIHAGCGIIPIALARTVKGTNVFATDPNPRAIESCQQDMRTLPEQLQAELRGSIRFMTAEMFPPPSNLRYDCVVFAPDLMQLSHYEEHDTPFAPGLTGIDGQLEMFFETAKDYMRDWGVAVVVYSNLRTLLEPTKPHPVEEEIKKNRRWVVLDYFDTPMRQGGEDEGEHNNDIVPAYMQRIQRALRAEVWVLHAVEAIEQFGFVHGVPGASPPQTVTAQWHKKRLKTYRKKVIKAYADLSGTTVRDVKERIRSIQEDTADSAEEDSEAQYLRMAIDPEGYSEELLRRQSIAMSQRDAIRREDEERIAVLYRDKSPREVFDLSRDPKTFQERKQRVGGGDHRGSTLTLTSM